MEKNNAGMAMEWGWGAAVLNRKVGRGLLEKRGEGGRQGDSRGTSTLGSRNSACKGPGAGDAALGFSLSLGRVGIAQKIRT